MLVADTELHEAFASALGLLLDDKDVASVDVVEGGLPEVVRRGRRERLHVLVEGPLFQVLRERGVTEQPLSTRLTGPGGGAVVVAAPLRDGRIAVSVRRPEPTDALLSLIVEEGVIPAGVDDELVAAVWQGTGVIVLGPARAARHRVAIAIARAVGTQLRIVALGDDVPAGGWPAPHVGDIVERAQIACALGADVLFALDVSAAEAVRLQHAALPVPLVLGVAVSSMENLLAALNGTSLRALCGLAAVIAWDGEGRPRLVELHGDSASPDTAPALQVQSVAASLTPTTPVPFSAPTSSTTSMRAPISSVPSLASLRLDDGPPAHWASADIDDDPGWELGPLGDTVPATLSAATVRPAPGSFDAALKAAAAKPTFSPRPPPMHPQTSALRGTGGLTLEPPGGGAPDDEETP